MTITIDLPPETTQRLEAEASLAGRPLNDYIVDIINSAPFKLDESLIAALRGNAEAGTSGRKRNLGFAAGEITISPDFDAPLELV